MEKLVLVNIESQRIPDWGGDEPEMYADKVDLKFEDKALSYKVSEGESEDMMFGRNLEDCGTIVSMIELAHECGKNGAELEIKFITEE